MSMKKLTFILLSLLPLSLLAQNYNQLTDNGEFIQGSDAWGNRKDTLKAEHREIPRGLKVWTNVWVNVSLPSPTPCDTCS